MSISELQLVYQLRKEKREEERKKREQQQQQLEKSNDLIQSHLNTLRQSNMQNAQNLKTIGGAVAHGILAGTSEALTERMLKKQQYNEFLDTIDKLRTEAEFNTQQQQISDNWLRQNYNGLGGVVSFLPQMNATQAGRALNPYINDLTRATGQNAEIVDVNTETGMLTLKNNDTNELDQINLYNLFPGIKSLILKQRSLQNAGFYDDRDLEEQLLRQNQANQQRLDREQQRLDRRENREDEKWAYQRSAMDQQRLQQDQMSEELPENWNAEKENDYTNHKKEYIKQNPTITKENNDFMGLTDGIKNEVIPSIKRLVELRNNMKAMMGNNQFSWVSSSPGEFAEKLREGIAGGEPVKTFLSSLTNVGEEEKQMIKNIYNVSKQIYMPLYARYADVVLGKGVRSDKDMQIFKNMLTSLFQSDEGFNASINEMKAMINGSLNTVNSKIARNKDLISEAYLDRNQFNEKYYGNR